jgi:hypothetical protein
MQHNLARQHRIALASSYVTMCHTGWGQWWCIWRCVWCDRGCTKDNKEGSPSTAPSSQLARALCLLREQPVGACANTKEAWSKAYSCLWSGHQPTRKATSPLAAAPIAVGCACTKEARQSWPYNRVRSPTAAAGPSACQRCYVPISLPTVLRPHQPANGATSPLAAEPIRQRLTISSSEGFSSAASTRSLSFSCLLTAASVE